MSTNCFLKSAQHLSTVSPIKNVQRMRQPASWPSGTFFVYRLWHFNIMQQFSMCRACSLGGTAALQGVSTKWKKTSTHVIMWHECTTSAEVDNCAKSRINTCILDYCHLSYINQSGCTELSKVKQRLWEIKFWELQVLGNELQWFTLLCRCHHHLVTLEDCLYKYRWASLKGMLWDCEGSSI